MEKGKGEAATGKYTQRLIDVGNGEPVKLDIFTADRENWGLTLAIRTGSAEYSHKVLASTWVKKGYNSVGGYLVRNKKIIAVKEEQDLFNLLQIPFQLPEFRNT